MNSLSERRCHRRFVVTRFPGYAVVGVMLFSASLAIADVPNPTLEEFRQLNAQCEASLGSWRLSERISRTKSDNPGIAARRSAHFSSLLVQMLAAARQDYDDLPGADETGWIRREAQIREQLARQENIMVLQDSVNSGAPVLRARTVDLAQERVRWDDVDLRDLDQLVAERGLDALERANVDLTTSSVLRDASHAKINAAKRHVLRTRHGSASPELERVRVGIVPRNLLAAENAATIQWPNGPDVAVVTSTMGGGSTRAVVDRALGWRMVRYEIETPNGDRLSWSFEEYSSMGGILVPRRIVHRGRIDGVDDYFVEEMNTIGFEANLSPDLAVFEVPADFRIQFAPDMQNT